MLKISRRGERFTCSRNVGGQVSLSVFALFSPFSFHHAFPKLPQTIWSCDAKICIWTTNCFCLIARTTRNCSGSISWNANAGKTNLSGLHSKSWQGTVLLSMHCCKQSSLLAVEWFNSWTSLWFLCSAFNNRQAVLISTFMFSSRSYPWFWTHSADGWSFKGD